MSTGKQ